MTKKKQTSNKQANPNTSWSNLFSKITLDVLVRNYKQQLTQAQANAEADKRS